MSADTKPSYMIGSKVVLMGSGLPPRLVGRKGTIVSTSRLTNSELPYEVKLDDGEVAWFSWDELKLVTPDTPLASQVAGDHYILPIQPVQYIHANNLGFMEGNVLKYITRHKNKGGVDDLKKAAHYINLLMELEYGQSS